MKIYISLLTLIATIPAMSQDIEKETWTGNPVLHSIDNRLKNESAVVIMDKRRVEYVPLKDGIVVYRTMHRIIHINDDKGIESFNRVYLPVFDNADIIDIKARTILPDGKIIEIDKRNIKDLKESEDEVYKIFAMEGLVKGCEVEFYYTYKRNTSFFGSEIVQGRTPVMEASIELIAPGRLIFEMKGFNATAKPMDTLLNDKRWVTVTEKNIPGVEEEKYAPYEANLRRFEYKLAFNTAQNPDSRLFTWDELAKRIYQNYSGNTDKEIKRVNELISDMKVKDLPGEMAKIAAVENYIKANFNTQEDISGEDAVNLEKVIKNKLANSLGIGRLYSTIFRQLEIPHELVLAADRTKMSIDRNFENWNNCDNLLFYFTSLKKFMAPTLQGYRFPWIDPNWGGAYGFFCKSTTIGGFSTAFGEVKMIPLEDYTQSTINMEATITLNRSTDTLDVDIRQIYSGYAASTYRSIFNFADEENKRLVTKEMIKFGTKSENVVNSKMENQDFESYHTNKPFMLSASVKASELVEKAGNKILVKIGDIIGPQVEMYQEKPRQFPMEIDYPHVLERKITFNIPEGYIIKNPDDIKINHTYQEKGQLTMGFTSSYQLEGNTIKLHIIEEYRRITYPLSQFEDFRKVINAAADFNKVVLVLEKKQ